jgi:thiamine-phosphate pyrophosphorylase
VCSAAQVDPFALAEGCLRGGVRVLQIRAKDDSSARLLALVERVVAVARPLGGRVIVNDRADIARIAEADGVHVGQSDLPIEAVVELLGPGGIVGVSTHDRDQIDRALAGPAHYVAVGPIYPTVTKETRYTPRGLELVTYAAGRGKPIVAIGGITLERAPAVAAAGASAVAVIGDLLVGGNHEARVRAFLASLPGQLFNV